MRLRPPLPSWVGKPQFKQGVPHYPTRIGIPCPRSAEQRSMLLLFEEMARSRIR